MNQEVYLKVIRRELTDELHMMSYCINVDLMITNELLIFFTCNFRRSDRMAGKGAKKDPKKIEKR